jgi:DNA polymerase IV (DinB-like DNA polymerase)
MPAVLPERVIAFVDLDYFFAQVEELQRPDLADKPLVVCVFSGRTSTSGVVSSANYVARSYGVRAGMPISRAMKLLPPSAIFLPVRTQLYSEVSGRVMSILAEYADSIRVESIDEASLDITEKVGGDFDHAHTIAGAIKERLRSELGLKCSVGVAPNRIVAKIAADISKPDGLKIVRPEDVKSFLQPIEVGKLPGVGAKLGAMLGEKGVKTIGDLADLPIDELIKIAGRKRAIQLKLAAEGRLEEKISPRDERRQFSRIITLKRDTNDVEEVMAQLTPLIAELKEKLVKSNLGAHSLGLQIVSSQLKTITRQKAIHLHEDIQKSIRELLLGLLSEEPQLMIRRAGVRFSGLVRLEGQSTLTSFNADNP